MKLFFKSRFSLFDSIYMAAIGTYVISGGSLLWLLALVPFGIVSAITERNV